MEFIDCLLLAVGFRGCVKIAIFSENSHPEFISGSHYQLVTDSDPEYSPPSARGGTAGQNGY